MIITTLENLRLSEKQYMDNLTVFTESLTTVNLVDLGKVVGIAKYCLYRYAFCYVHVQYLPF